MKNKQKEQQKGFKLVKLRTETLKDLDKLISKIEKRQPYLKGLVSYNAVVSMLLSKKKIKLSKYRYLEKQKR